MTGDSRKFLLFTRVSAEASEKLLRSASSQEASEILETVTSLIDSLKTEEKIALKPINIAFHVQNCRFGIEQEFSGGQLSTFLAIMQETLEAMILGRFHFSSALSYFKNLLLIHSVELPPFSLGIFAYDEVNAITEFSIDTFFRFFEFYRFAFVPHVVLKVATVEVKRSAENQASDSIFDFSRPISKEELDTS